MPYSNYTEDLLDLKDLIVTNVRTVNSEKHIWIELKRRVQTCPRCGTLTDQIHDYRMQPVKDISVLGHHTILLLRKRRYSCPCCGRSISEANSFLPRYQRMISRMRQYIISRFSQMRSAAIIAEECGCSDAIAVRLFGSVSYPRPNLANVIASMNLRGMPEGISFSAS